MRRQKGGSWIWVPPSPARVFWLTLPALASEKLPVRTAGMDWGEASPVRRLPLGHAKQMAGRLPGKVRETSQGIPESNRRRLVVWPCHMSTCLFFVFCFEEVLQM